MKNQNEMATTARSQALPQVESLVELARGGDRSAFDCLVGQYREVITRHVSRMVYDVTEAEDVVQETFVHAYQALVSLRDVSIFRAWLYRIASNLAIDAARSKRRRSNTVSIQQLWGDDDEARTGDEALTEVSPGPAEELERRELRRLVWEGVQALSDRTRPVIVLFDLQGQSYQEIASILGCPLGTVKSRLFNARAQLRAKLKYRLPAGETCAADCRY